MSGWKVSSGCKSSNRLLPLALGPPLPSFLLLDSAISPYASSRHDRMLSSRQRSGCANTGEYMRDRGVEQRWSPAN